MPVDLSTKTNGYYGYLEDEVRQAIGETQASAAHFESTFVVGGPTGAATHGLTILSGGLDVESDTRITGELEVASGKVILNHTLVPIHADNAAAVTAGLEVGHVYATPDGTLKMVILI